MIQKAKKVADTQVKERPKPISCNVSDWILTEKEERIALARAKYDKIKRIEWLRRSDPVRSDGDLDSLVKLTPEESKAALEAANRTKSAKIYFDSLCAENREKEIERENQLKKEWDYAKFFKLMKSCAGSQGKVLLYNDQTSLLIQAICFRLSGDARYETELGFSFQKVLVIRGAPGLGKSWIPSLVADNPVSPMQIVTTNEITETVRKSGEYTGLKFGTYKQIYVDDLGTEETPVKYFGTDITWFKSWYEWYYATAKSHMGRLIISTNETFDSIGDKYGFRVRDRMRECCDVLDLVGPSMRK